MLYPDAGEDGYTALHKAVSKPEGARLALLLIRNGANVNAVDACKRTTLHVASAGGHVAEVRLLVQYGADMSARDVQGWLPLHHAVLADQAPVAMFLMERMPHVDIAEPSASTGKTLLHIAVEHGSVACTQALVQAGAPLGVRDAGPGETVFHAAVRKAHATLLALLVSFGRDEALLRNKEQLSPFLLALQLGHGACAAVLADYHAAEPRNPLAPVLAGMGGSVECIALLAHLGCDLDAYDSRPQPLPLATQPNTSKHAAGGGNLDQSGLSNRSASVLDALALEGGADRVDADGDSVEVLQVELSRAMGLGAGDHPQQQQQQQEQQPYYASKFSIRSGGTNNNEQSQFPVMSFPDPARTCAFMCASHGHLDALALAHSLGASMRLVDHHGWTLLHHAVAKGHAEVAEFLITTGGLNVQASAPPEQLTPLHLAVLHRERECVSLLLRYSASPNMMDSRKRTPLFHACAQGFLDVLPMLFEAGASSSPADDTGATCAHACCGADHARCLEYLMARDHELLAVTDEGHTVMHVAAAAGAVACVEALLRPRRDGSLHPDAASLVALRDFAGHTPMHIAAQHNHAGVMALLAECGGDVDARDLRQRTPLHLACMGGHTEACEMALELMAHVVVDDEDDMLPVMYACARGHLGCASVMYFRSVGETSESQYIKSTCLHLAMSNDHADVVGFLLRAGADPDAQLEGGRTSLHVACEKNDFELVKVLMERGAALNLWDQHSTTPLHVAAEHASLPLCRHLVTHGALVNTIDDDGRTAVHVAARHDRAEVFEYLVTKADGALGMGDNNGSTPLHVACGEGAFGVVRFLLTHWSQESQELNTATLFYMPDKSGATPLQHAARGGQGKIVTVLLSQLNAEQVNARDHEGKTALHAAAAAGHAVVAAMLLEGGADLHLRDEVKGDTALHVAARAGSLDCAVLLHQAGADVWMENADHHTPAHCACSAGALDTVDFLANLLLGQELQRHLADFRTQHLNHQHGEEQGGREVQAVRVRDLADATSQRVLETLRGMIQLAVDNADGAVVNLLVRLGAPLDVVGAQGESLLHTAASKGNTSAVHLLVGLGLSLQAADMYGATPLHYASGFGQVSTVRYLLQANAAVDAVDNDQRTPLHLACLGSNAEVVAELMLGGASADMLDLEGFAPIHVAAAFDQHRNIHALVSHGAPVNQRDELGRSALHLAANKDATHSLVELLEGKANVELVDLNGFTPLLTAIKKGHVTAMRQLLDAGAQVMHTTLQSYTSLHYAAQKKMSECVHLILQSIRGELAATRAAQQSKLSKPKQQHGEEKKGPQHLRGRPLVQQQKQALQQQQQQKYIEQDEAEEEEEKEHTRQVAQPDATNPNLNDSAVMESFRLDFVNTQEQHGYTALHYAAEVGDTDSVRHLVLAGADLLLCTTSGDTALELAVKAGHYNASMVLLDHGGENFVDRPHAQHELHWTPLFFAAAFGHARVAELLGLRGASLHLADDRGWLALQYAVDAGHLPSAQILVAMGCDIHVTDDKGLTLMHIAAGASSPQVEMIQWLFRQGLSFTETTRHRAQALHMAARANNAGLIRYILANVRGIDVNARDDNSATPLHYASRAGHREAIEALVSSEEALLNCRTSEGKTALHIAVDANHEACVEVLLLHGASVESHVRGAAQ